MFNTYIIIVPAGLPPHLCLMLGEKEARYIILQYSILTVSLLWPLVPSVLSGSQETGIVSAVSREGLHPYE